MAGCTRSKEWEGGGDGFVSRTVSQCEGVVVGGGFGKVETTCCGVFAISSPDELGDIVGLTTWSAFCPVRND